MLRVVVETCDAGMAAHVGGSVEKQVRTFDIDVPELDAFLREYTKAVEAAKDADTGGLYWHRQVVGVEVLPDGTHEDVEAVAGL